MAQPEHRQSGYSTLAATAPTNHVAQNSITEEMKPEITVSSKDENRTLAIALNIESLHIHNPEINITAVLNIDKTLSYWAIKHSNNKPDFHDQTCYTKLI